MQIMKNLNIYDKGEKIYPIVASFIIRSVNIEFD